MSRRKYSDEERNRILVEAKRMVDEHRLPIKVCAKELGVPYGTLSCWYFYLYGKCPRFR